MRGIIYDAERDQYISARGALSFSHGGNRYIEVKNKSVFGSTIVKGAQLLDRAIQSGLSSDIVLIKFGGNDCSIRWRDVASEPQKEHHPKPPLNLFKRIYRSMIGNIRDVGAIPLVMNLPPIDADRYISHICRDRIPKNSLLQWFERNRSIDFYHELYNNCIEQVARETSTSVIDVRSIFHGLDNYSSLLCNDGVHPTFKGYTLIDDVIRASVEILVNSYVSTNLIYNRSFFSSGFYVRGNA